MPLTPGPLQNFIPQIWVARLEEKLRRAHVYAQAGVVNRDYEGEIKAYGDTVKINAIGEVTVSDYAKNTDINPPETLTASQKLLVIDQAKYFNFQVDDVEKAQANVNIMDGAMESAGFQVSDVVDSYVANLMVSAAGVVTLGSNASPIDLTPSNASAPLDAYRRVLVEARTLLLKANVPMEGRFGIVPPEFSGLLLQEDRFLTRANEQSVLNGEFARSSGFRLLESNNVPSVVVTGTPNYTVYKLVFGTTRATSFAEQIVEMEAYRPERRFADAVKGLQVYGSRVLKPETLVVATVRFS